MKKYITFILLAAVPFLGFTIKPESGLKKTNAAIQFSKHNPKKGLNLLESKINRKVAVEWNNKNSSPVFVGGTLTARGYSFSNDKSIDGKRFLSDNIELFGIKDPNNELSVISNFKDKLLMSHIKYQQQIHGIKIYGGQIIVHINNDGSIESVNGRYYPTPEINTTPKMDAASAINSAKVKLGSYKAKSENAELIIYTGNNQFKLAYVVNLPSYQTPNMRVFVDALDGSILKVDDGIRYDGPSAGTGIDLNGASQSINTYLYQGNYVLLDASLPMFHVVNNEMQGTIQTYDAKNDTSGEGNEKGYKSVELISDPNKNNSFDDNARLRAAVSAHINTRKAYEFFRSNFNRDSYDNKKATIFNIVHYMDKLNNAYWNGSSMVFGDGDDVHFSNLAGAYDVIVHEFAHAVTSSTADLLYEVQSGALNESISDVFASLADSTDWLIGEDVYTPSISDDALRSMLDPHNGGTSMNDYRWQPAHMNEFVNLPNDEPNDWGGVHTNSGIPNKAFYNVAIVIGHWKAGQIWYRSLTSYLTNNSQFKDLRTACLTSAKELYGDGSPEYIAVDNGFKDVGLDGSSGNQTTTELSYDDGSPDDFVWQNTANWSLATKFSPSVSNAQLSMIKVYIGGVVDPSTTTIYYENESTLSFDVLKADGDNGFPGTMLLSSNPITVSRGTIEQATPAVTINGDFYISCVYHSNIYQPIIGYDENGNSRAYEYNPDDQKWYLLEDYYGSDFNINLYIRAVLTTTTGVTEIDSRIPDKFEISSNYPNPFNPSTSFKYSLPSAENVDITIYDLNGKEIAKLVDNNQNAGTYVVTWNGKNNSGVEVSSGVYFYRIRAGNFLKTNKMMLLK